jgi:hypothetical protein
VPGDRVRDRGGQGALVVAFFMHLAGGRPIHRIVFAIGFMLLLVPGVLADVGTRSLASSYLDDLGAGWQTDAPRCPGSSRVLRWNRFLISAHRASYRPSGNL